MKTIRLTTKSQMLHVEAPGCIVNIDPGLCDTEGRKVCRVDVNADGNRYSGNPQWWIEGEAGHSMIGFRVIQTDTPKPPTGPLKPVECEQIAALLDDLLDWETGVFGGSDAPVWKEVSRMRQALRGVPEASTEREG